MSIKINIIKKGKKKLKVNILYIIITFYRIFFFLIIFLLEKTPKIKSIYGKQDYQPDAKIKT